MSLVTFLVSGTLLSFSVWIAQRTRWSGWLRGCVALLTSSLLVFFIYLQTGPVLLGNERWFEKSPYVEGLFFLLMISGMAARYLTKAIEARREKIAELQKHGDSFATPGIEFDAWEFAYPLFVSVVTFGALISQLKDHSLTVSNSTLSFQTGFFWQTVLDARQRR